MAKAESILRATVGTDRARFELQKPARLRTREGTETGAPHY